MPTAGHGPGNSPSKETIASERLSSCSAAVPAWRENQDRRRWNKILDPSSACFRSIPNPRRDSEAANRSRSRRSRLISQRTVRLHSAQWPSKMTSDGRRHLLLSTLLRMPANSRKIQFAVLALAHLLY